MESDNLFIPRKIKERELTLKKEIEDKLNIKFDELSKEQLFKLSDKIHELHYSLKILFNKKEIEKNYMLKFEIVEKLYFNNQILSCIVDALEKLIYKHTS